MDLTALGAHIYAGTHTIGTERHFKVLAHFEDGYKAGIATARLNWPDMPIHDKPWPSADYTGIVDYVYCNPPCAIFSAAGIRTTRGADAWRTDPRRGCWYDCFGLLDIIKPRAMSIESVCQAYTTGREMIDELTKLALIRGYSVSHVMVNAMWHAVPQKRRRFFLVIHRPNRLVTRPMNWAPPTTVGEALAEATPGGEPVSAVTHSHAASLRIAKPGDGIREVWEVLNPPESRVVNGHGEVKGRPSFNEGRLDMNRPMGAFIGNFYYHPTEDRRLTGEEMKALCGVPENFQLAGPTNHWASLLARGVMPAVAAWLAESIKNTLYYPDGDWRDRTVFLIDLREPGREVVNLTPDYLDANGRVRLRIRADGSIASSTMPLAPIAKRVGVEALMPVVPAGSAFEAGAIDGTPGPASVHQEAAERHENAVYGGVSVARPDDVAAVSRTPAKDRESSTTGTIDLKAGDEVVHLVEGTLLKPLPNEGSGKFMKRLWLQTALTPDEIVALVHENWEGRTTKRSDMYYNFNELVKSGVAVRPWSTERMRRREDLWQAAERPVVEQGERCDSGTASGTTEILPQLRQSAPPTSDDSWRGVVPTAVQGGSSPSPLADREEPVEERGEACGVELPATVGLQTSAPQVRHPRSSTGASIKHALLTGSTPIQVGSQKTVLKIMSNQECWRDALMALGYAVDWRPVRPGEDLSGYDFVMAALNKPNAIVSKHVYGALWCLMTRPDAVACVDDWQTLELQPGFRTCSRDFVRAFRINGVDTPLPIKERLFEYLARLARDDAPWPFPVVTPLFDGGDASLLGIRGEVVAIDPTNLSRRYSPIEVEKERRWIQASLLVKDSPRTAWPVDRYGSPGKRGFHPGDNEHLEEPRVTEAALMDLYCGVWGVISPAHNHPGSGWWRVRYLMAADAGCVLSADRAEASVIGEPYVFASDVAKVEALNDDGLEGLVVDQRECLETVAWPRERVVEAFRELIERAS